MTKVVVIDDDRIVREYIRAVLARTEGEFDMIGEASNGNRGLKLLEEVKPDILILDMEMPSMNGIELLNSMEEKKMSMSTLVLSCHDEFDYVRQAMKLGAADYLLKHKIDDKTIIDSLRSLRDKKTNGERGYRKEIARAISYIEEHYKEDFSLEDIAKYVCVSKTYFSSMFKKETGKNLSLYLLDFRLKKACELLRESDEKIYNVAYETGFQSHNYFNNIFKEKYGMTPKEYRKSF